MHRLWESLIKHVFDILHPTSIVEIGSEQGENTLNIVEYCFKHGGVVHVIDPEPKYDVDEWRHRYGEGFVFYKELSLNALLKINVYDIVLIDGDHNWYTVFNELLLIERNAKKKGCFPVIMLHDVEWPYGRRDLYYHPENIPDIYRKPYQKKGISLNKGGLVDEGGLNDHLYNAIYENNLQNGVLTAVEDFLEQSKEDFSLTIVSGIHGLGILVPLSILEQKPRLAEFLESLKMTPPMSKQLCLIERLRIEEVLTHKKAAVSFKEKQAKGQQVRERLQASIQEKEQALEEMRSRMEEERTKGQEQFEQFRTDLLEKERQLTEIRSKLEQEGVEAQREREHLQASIQEKEQVLIELQHEVSRKTEEIRNIEVLVNQKNYERNKVIENYQNSLSWKITKPLRYAHSIMIQLKRMKLKASNKLRNTHNYPSYAEITAFVKKNLKAKQFCSSRKVSIVILNRNGKKYLQRCFDSIKKNINNSNYEIIVVDNASNDGSLDFLRSLSLENLKLIENKGNVSFSKANNQAVKIATGVYLLFLNNDTEPLYNWLNEMLYVIEHDKHSGVVGSKLIYPERGLVANYDDLLFPDHSIQHMGITFYDEGDFVRPVNEGINIQPLDKVANIQREVPAVTAACMLVRKDLFEKVGGFDERYFYGYEDVDFCLKIRKIGYRIIYCPTSTLFHYEFGTQNFEFKDEKRKNRTINIEVFTNKWYRFLKKKLLMDQLNNAHFYTKKTFKIGIAITEDNERTPAGDYYTAKGLGKELEKLGYEIIYLPRIPKEQWYDIPDDLNILLVLIDHYDLRKIENNKKIIKVAWIRNWVERWIQREWFDKYDLILTTSRESRRLIREKTGKDSEVLMIGADTDIFKPVESKEEFASDIVFTGNYWDVNREIIDSLKVAQEWNFHIYGNNWNKVENFKKYWRGFIDYKKLPNIYSSSKIVLDDHNHVTKPYGMINSRVFEAMACGCCLITNAAKDINEIFPEDIIFVYHDSDELTFTIKELLANNDKRREIGEKAKRLILKNHTYTIRAKQFKEILIKALKDEIFY